MTDHSKPALGRGVRLRADPITNEPLLLFPEGVLPLDDATREILTRCTGHATVSEIVAALSEAYDEEPAVLRADVLECLTSLRHEMLIRLT